MTFPIPPFIASSTLQTAGRLSHVTDSLHRYPGEVLTLHTCLREQSGLPSRSVSVSIPSGVEMISFEPVESPSVRSCGVREEDKTLTVEWELADQLLVGDKLEFTIQTRVQPVEYDCNLKSVAIVRDGEGQELDSETARVRILTHSSYINYLPEIYHENDFLNRLLMLFESFWKPTEMQINQSELYFDGSMTPPAFLPWMASWVGITWDENLPDERKRALLRSAVGIFQARGTRQALIDYLTTYTHGQVDIIEHRAQNFILGLSAPLGRTIALGRHNFPHTFTVLVRVRRSEVVHLFGENQVNAEKFFRRQLEAIIEAQKPAHTTFDLNVEIID